MCWKRRDDGNRYDGRELGTTTTSRSIIHPHGAAQTSTDALSTVLGAREKKGAAKKIGLSRGRRPPGSRVEGAKNIS